MTRSRPARSGIKEDAQLLFGSRRRDTWGSYFSFLVGSALVLGLFYLWWTGGPNFHVVVPGRVFRSAQPTPEQLARYHEKFGIEAVANLRGEWKGSSWYESEREACEANGLRLIDINLNNYQLPPLDELRRLVDLLSDEDTPVLLHCRSGSDRTALASAIARLLAGEPISVARQEFSIRYGHLGLAHGSHLPSLLDLYARWLLTEGKMHSPEAFHEWVESIDSLHYFSARIEPIDRPTHLDAGEPWDISLRITNTSKVEWPGIDYPMKVNAWVRMTESGKEYEQSVYMPREVISPGKSSDVVLPMMPLIEPGKYELEVDLCDPGGIKFRVMGPFNWKGYLEVSAAVDDEQEAASR